LKQKFAVLTGHHSSTQPLRTHSKNQSMYVHSFLLCNTVADIHFYCYILIYFPWFFLCCSFDYGFYSILYMEYYNAKGMMLFDSDSIPLLRKSLAATLINGWDNHQEDMEELMNEELMPSS
jgi:hypothetical protein